MPPTASHVPGPRIFLFFIYFIFLVTGIYYQSHIQCQQDATTTKKLHTLQSQCKQWNGTTIIKKLILTTPKKQLNILSIFIHPANKLTKWLTRKKKKQIQRSGVDVIKRQLLKYFY